MEKKHSKTVVAAAEITTTTTFTTTTTANKKMPSMCVFVWLLTSAVKYIHTLLAFFIYKMKTYYTHIHIHASWMGQGSVEDISASSQHKM